MKSIGRGIAVLILVLGMPHAAAASGSGREPVYRFADGQPVSGAWSQVQRTDAGASFALTTRELTQGHSVTVWWVIFNEPANCTHPTPFSACGAGDLPPFGGDDSAITSVLYAAGHVIGESGKASFAGALAVGDNDEALFGPGLIDPHGAEIHLVVRDHGNVPPQDRSDAIHQFGVCNPSCTDLQFSVQQ